MDTTKGGGGGGGISPNTPGIDTPDVRQEKRDKVRRLLTVCRDLLDQAAAILDDTDPTDKERGK